MKKLHLDLDQLSVESFDTATDAAARAGTVRGAELAVCPCCCCCPCCCTVGDSCGGTCFENTCATCPASCNGSCDTCYQSCYGSCDYTCWGSCGWTCDPWQCGGGTAKVSCIIECQIYQV